MMNVLLFMSLYLFAVGLGSDLTELSGFSNDLERIGRQFAAIGDRAKAEGDANVAMSLVDALQKWADALEQQISLMRLEVVGLKTSNGQLVEKVSVLERDNGRLSGELGRMSLKLDELTGKISNVGEDMKHMEVLKDDVVVMSTTFNQFIDHFQNYSLNVMTNYSLINDQMEITSSSYSSLVKAVESMSTESKSAISSLANNMDSVTLQISSMESSLTQYKNFTLVRIETIEKEMSSFTETMVNRTMIEKLVTHISDELNEIHIVTASNFTNMSNELKVMGTAFHHTLYNASVLIFNDVEDIKKNVEQLNDDVEDLKKSEVSFKKDLIDVTSSIEALSGNNDDKWKTSELKIMKVNKDLENLSTKLVDLNLRLRDAEILFPEMNKMNVSFSTLLNTLRFNLTQLDLTSNSLRSGIFKLEAKVMAAEQTISSNSNSSIVILGKLRKFEDSVVDLENKIVQVSTGLNTLAETQAVLANNASALGGHVKTLELGLFELGSITKRGEVNNTQLQISYRNLEKHFVEFKRELFEANMDLVSLNVSLASLGDVRQDIMAVSQAVANTTNFLTSKIEEVSERSSLIRHEVGVVANQTLLVDDRLQRFINNHTFSTGNMFHSMLKLKDEIVRFQNKTSYLEMGMAGLMNFSLEMDGSLRVVQQNLTYCVHSITEITSNATDTLIKVHKMSELSSHHHQLLIEYSQNLEGNVTKLSLADNLLETELSRIISGYKGLKLAMSNHLHSIGGLEEGIKVLSQDSEAWKTHLDSMRYELNTIKSETTSVNVFFNTMQSHISALSSNISGVVTNVTFCMDEIEDSKLHIHSLTSDVDDMKTNFEKISSVLHEKDSKFDEYKVNITNIRTNLVGLGNYINNINGDLSQLLVSFDSYAKKMSTEMNLIKSNISDVFAETTSTKTVTSKLKEHLESVEFVSSSMKDDINGLTTKILNVKTNLFEQTNEMTTVKASQNHLQSLFEKMETKFESMVENEASSTKHMDEMKSEFGVVKTGFSR